MKLVSFCPLVFLAAFSLRAAEPATPAAAAMDTASHAVLQPVTYTLKHIPYYGGQFNPKDGQITRYKEQVVQVVLQKGEEKKVTLQELFGWATDQMSSMEGCLLISPSPVEAKAGTAIRFSVPPNDSGERMYVGFR